MKIFSWLKNRFKPSPVFDATRINGDMIIHIAPDGTKQNFVFGQTVYGKDVVRQQPSTVIEYVGATNAVRFRSKENVGQIKSQADRLPYDIGAEAYHQRKHYSENPYSGSDWQNKEWWLGWDSCRESSPETWDDDADDFSENFKTGKEN